MELINQRDNMPLKPMPRRITIGISTLNSDLCTFCDFLFLFPTRFDVDTRLNMLKRVNDGGDLPGSGHAGDKGYFAR